MTELKTLKEITYFKRADGTPCEGHLPDVQELRQEAIKWIKHFKEMSERDCLADNNDKIVCYPEDQCDVCEMSDWYDGAEQKFMEFFNITEEELK